MPRQPAQTGYVCVCTSVYVCVCVCVCACVRVSEATILDWIQREEEKDRPSYVLSAPRSA